MINFDKLRSFGLFWLRLMAGAGLAWHGYQKVFQYGVDKFATGVAGMGFPMPLVFAWAATLAEFLGGAMLVLGVKTRAAAFFAFVTMTVAAFVAHGKDPLAAKELALAYWTATGVIFCVGPGSWSIDEG